MPVATAIHPSYLTWLGLSHESAYGTPALTSTLGPVWTMPLEASSFDPEDKPTWLRDMAIRGSMADLYAIVQGVEDSAWSLGGPVYPGLTAVLLDNMFGDITTTPTGGTLSDTTTTLTAAYTRNSSGPTLKVTAGTPYTSGVIGKISTTSGYTEYFTCTGVTSDTVTITAPLHYDYPVSGTTVSYYTDNPTSYTHLFAALNSYDGQPPTWTMLDSTGVTDTLNGTTDEDADPYGQRFYTSMCLAELDFTVSAEALFTQKASGTAWVSGPTSQLESPPTAPYAPETVTTVPVPSWSSSITLDLPDVNGTVDYVGEVTFSFKRKLQVYWTNDGSQNPFIIARGPLGCTGTVNAAVAEDEQLLQSMLKNFQGTLSATVTVPEGTPYPDAEQGLTYQFDVEVGAFTAAKPGRSDVLVGYDATYEAVANTVNVGQSAGLGVATVTVTDGNPNY